MDAVGKGRAQACADHGQDHEADRPAPPPEAASLLDEGIDFPRAHWLRVGPGVEQCHDTASIMAMTSAGW